MTAWALNANRRLPETPGRTVCFIARTIYPTITSTFRSFCQKTKGIQVTRPSLNDKRRYFLTEVNNKFKMTLRITKLYLHSTEEPARQTPPQICTFEGDEKQQISQAAWMYFARLEL
jgi:hypothetical protein